MNLFVNEIITPPTALPVTVSAADEALASAVVPKRLNEYDTVEIGGFAARREDIDPGWRFSRNPRHGT